MRLSLPNIEIVNQEPAMAGVFKQIEYAGRICYKSHDKMMDGSSEEFVNRMINSGHNSVLEHGTIYLVIPNQEAGVCSDFEENKFSHCEICNGFHYVTTNYRVIVENDFMDYLKYMVDEPSQCHHLRISVKFNTQIAVSREFNRHRTDSIVEQSTRYCNYARDKFNNEITINTPTFLSKEDLDEVDHMALMFDLRELFDFCYDKEDIAAPVSYWMLANRTAEFCYMKMIEKGWKAQEARTILPLDTNTELVHTAFIKDWKHFLELRTSSAAHPDIQVLANNIRDEFTRSGLI